MSTNVQVDKKENKALVDTSAAAQKKLAAKAKKLEAKKAYLAKRAAKMTELKAKDMIKWRHALSIREARELGLVDKGSAGWKAFCQMKAEAASTYWMTRAAAAGGSEKAVERMKARKARLAEMIAKLDAQLGTAGVPVGEVTVHAGAPAVTAALVA